jgi:hypothetical protein
MSRIEQCRQASPRVSRLVASRRSPCGCVRRSVNETDAQHLARWHRDEGGHAGGWGARGRTGFVPRHAPGSALTSCVVAWPAPHPKDLGVAAVDAVVTNREAHSAAAAGATASVRIVPCCTLRGATSNGWRRSNHVRSGALPLPHTDARDRGLALGGSGHASGVGH